MTSQAATPVLQSAIDVEQPSLVLPAEATDEAPLYLTNYDQQVMFNMESVYFYPPSQKRASDNVVQVLRDALSKVLVPYHFMAGRLRMNVAEQRVEVDCNRAGALFASATTHLSFANLWDAQTFTSLLKDFILHGPTSVLDTPLLTVQVTKFSCGGFVIGISRNHAVVGGTSGDEFLTNFTSLARGEGLQVTPVAERSLLKARDPPRSSFEHVEYEKVGKVPRDSYFTTSQSLNDLELHGNFGAHFHLWKKFSFSSNQLISLKNQAVADGRLKTCTTFEALATHIWQARTQAVNMGSDMLSNLLFVVDSRKVLTPPLPAGFTGNTLSLACARMQSQDLASKPFSHCVKQVQDAKARITDEYVRSSIDWLEMNNGIPCINDGIYLSSWVKFNFLNVDFGWGPPSQTMFVPGASSKNCVVLLPSQEGIDVCLALEPPQASKFQQYTGSCLKWPPAPPPELNTPTAFQMGQRRCYSTSSTRIGKIAAAVKRNWYTLRRWRIFSSTSTVNFPSSRT